MAAASPEDQGLFSGVAGSRIEEHLSAHFSHH
jgi:hypothetical protein